METGAQTIVFDQTLESLPKHDRLRSYLLGELSEGRLKPGDPLPTEHQLASASLMSRSTVRRALDALEKNGLILRVPGHGTFVHEAAMQRLQAGDAHAEKGGDATDRSTFVLIVPDTRGGQYPSLQRGFHKACSGSKTEVVVSDTSNDPLQQSQVILEMMDRKVSGVAMVPSTHPVAAHQVRPLQALGIPVVFCHRRVEGVRAPLIGFPFLEMGRLAGQEMARFGHRRAAMFAIHSSPSVLAMQQGLRDALEKEGGEFPDEFLKVDDSHHYDANHEKFIAASLEEMLQHPQRPTVIFCPFDAIAEFVYLHLHKLGLSVPGDMSIISFGGSWREGAIARRLTAVTVDEEALGHKAVNLLSDIISGKIAIDSELEIMMPLSLNRGETLAQPSANPS
jgi:GntR family transcriptional regulator of arabinose operon